MAEEGLVRKLVKRRGNAVWDGVLRVTGVVALVAIPLTIQIPASGGLVGFAIVTIWVNGPISPFLPSTYEPILMLMGSLYDPLIVAVIGTAGTIYVEYLNYHLYQRVLQFTFLDRFRTSRWVEYVLKRFSRAPFFTVWLCSWSILPYWPVRFISPLAGYRVDRHLLATFLGRFPRLWFFAALGAWLNVPTSWLVAVSLGSIVLAVAVYLVNRLRGRSKASPDVAALEAAEG